MATHAPPPPPPPVPVQLTTITPLRVCDTHGDYFDTEVDVDCAVRSVQLAVEAHFKVKPAAQLLLHNRQQLDPALTLRENGCLLLKGEPYVRLTVLTRRGPLLNLICRTVGGGEGVTFPIAISEAATVLEAKRLLCGEMATRRPNTAVAPRQLRLTWRYLDLNDRAELRYYRIPTNSILTVRVRPADGRSRSPPSGAGGGGTTARPQAQPWQQPRPAPPPPIAYWLRDGTAPHQQQQQQHPLSHYQQQQQQQQVPPPPSAVAQARVPDDAVSALSRAVVSLEGELASLRAEVAHHNGSGGDNATSAALAAAQARAAADFSIAAGHRIAELERSVARFQLYLERAVALIP